MSTNLIDIQEHETILLDGSPAHNALAKSLCDDNYDPEKPGQLLGLDWNNRRRTSAKASYFIGLKWIEEGKSAIYVKPKIPNLDFMNMFIHCFDSECQDVVKNIGEIYHIEFNQKTIDVGSNKIQLTPLIIAHFLKLTQKLVKRGLKSNYIQREENLSGKVKGKVLMSQNLKRNHITGRNDRAYCKYQDYSIDCLENRVIKRVLIFINSYLSHNKVTCSEELKDITSYCLGAFSAVGDNVSIQQIKQLKITPLYREYASALKVAKIVLHRFSYNINRTEESIDNHIPPFWIDMSLLFELYVYSQLKAAYHNEVHYHIRTYGNEVDFVKFNEQLIIDTKYITKWEEQTNHDNVRQLSGYARNYKIRSKVLKTRDYIDTTSILHCLIIFPNSKSEKNFPSSEILPFTTNIETYLKFHKLGIKLPTL